jgi:hypothetical protein
MTATAIRNDSARERDEALERGDPDPWEGIEATDPAEKPWSQTNMLLGTLIDELRVMRWAWTVGHSAKGSRPPQPQLTRRPGVGKRDKRPYASSLTEEQRRRLDTRIGQRERAEQANEPEASEPEDGPTGEG